jgi:hypothetical protein
MNVCWQRVCGAIAVLGVAGWLASPSALADPAAKALPAATGTAPPIEKPAARPGATAAASRAAQPAAVDEADREKVLREQTIYIPYEKLRRVFEKEGRGVFLPYEKFQELWRAAQDKGRPAAEPRPPVGSLILESDNEATVAKDVVRVRARLKLEILAEGWTRVPLRLADAAITEATLAAQPARIVSAGDAGYQLLVEKKGKAPRQMELVLEYAKAIARNPGQNSVSFQAPLAPVSRWRVRIPEPGVKVSLHPLIAATEATGESSGAGGTAAARARPKAAPEETVILAFVGAAPTVRIEWTPKAEGATGLAALASVRTEEQVSISEGVIRTRAQLSYTISRAELGQLAIAVPAGQKVVNVLDANVRQWSVDSAGGQQKIAVQLFEPAKGSQNLSVELEELVPPAMQNQARAPVIRALGVGRQQGLVVVQVGEGLRAEAGRSSGLAQVDRGELPPALSQPHWDFAYRYAAVPFELEFSVEKIQPRIVVESLVEAELRPDRLVESALVVYAVERAGVFRLDLDLPAGFEVRQVRGRDAAGAAAAQVDGYYLEGARKTHLVVNLARKALGRVGLELELFKELHEPALLAPTGKSAEIGLGIPQIAPAPPAGPPAAGAGNPAGRAAPPPATPKPPAAGGAAGGAAGAGAAASAPGGHPFSVDVERYSGRLMIYAPESLRVNPSRTDGLRSISFQQALEGMESIRAGQSADARPVLAFAFTQEPAALSLAAERRKPQVTIRQLLVARVEDGVVKYQATFFYNILYSGVKSLRIDVPAELSGQVRNTTRAVREKLIDPPPAGLEKGYAAWSFTGESELLGDGRIELAWERKLDKLDVGATVPLAIPRLKPQEVDRAWGQIVLAKTESIDLDEPQQAAGLRPIDPQYDLMPGASVPGAARAFEFHDDWALVIPATRYHLQEIKHTNIERGVVRMVVTRAGKVSVQALYRVQSVRQRLEVRLPGKAVLDSQQRINGKPVTLEVGPQGEYLVPVAEPSADQSFLLELRYTVDGDARTLAPPEFPQEAAVEKVYLCAYLPQERALLHRRGPWTEQFDWRPGPALTWLHGNHVSEDQLLSWVCRPVAQPESFQTDGELYVFSALGPPPAPAGALRLSTVHQNWLYFGITALVLCGGLLLVPAPAAGRALAVGGLIVLVVLAGVFLPLLAYQVLNGVFVAAVFVVLVVWITRFWLRRLARGPVRFKAVEDVAAAEAGSGPPPAPPAGPGPEAPPAAPGAPGAAPGSPGPSPGPEGTPGPETPQGGPSHA